MLATDDDRRDIERALHDGVQQELVALSTGLQLAHRAVADDPAAAQALLDELRSQAREALAGVRKLAHGIYPPLLDGGGLRAALRLAAASGGRDAEVEVAPGTAWPPELAVAVFFSCVAVLERLPDRATPTIVVREEAGALVFRVAADLAGTAPPDLVRVQDRVEAFGGRLTVASDDAGSIRVQGSLPLA